MDSGMGGAGSGGPNSGMGGLGDIQNLMQQAQQMQEQLVNAQQELAETRVHGSSGGGLVTATVSGAGELQSLDIDRKAVDPDDTETLADLVVAAVRDANAAAQKLAEEKMGPMTGALGDMGNQLGGGFGLPGM